MTETTHERSGTCWTLIRRWPTTVALAAGALILAGGWDDVADAVDGLGQPMLLLPLEYLILNQIGRQAASWPVVGAMTVATLAVAWLDVIPLSSVIVGVALILLIWGAITGTPHGRGAFGVQAAGMLGFGALALVSLAVDPDLGRYLVAAGWFLHGVWDAVHLKLDKVVSRSYAEACGVVDVSVAAMLVFLV